MSNSKRQIESRNVISRDILKEINPDIQNLFSYFNTAYFNDQLERVEVKWSKRLTKCAGLCSIHGPEGCTISLSERLLKFRSNKDLYETLLHEMIHAFLYVTNGHTAEKSDHGQQFRNEAQRVNKAAHLNINIYHNFRKEVNYYRKYTFQCDGVCRKKTPNHGIIKRFSDRPPCKFDIWFDSHKRTCGGKFHKIVISPKGKREREEIKADKQDTDLNDVDKQMQKLKMI